GAKAAGSGLLTEEEAQALYEQNMNDATARSNATEARVFKAELEARSKKAARSVKRRADGKRRQHRHRQEEVLVELGRIWKELSSELERRPKVPEALERFRESTEHWRYRGTTRRTFERYMAAARRA